MDGLTRGSCLEQFYCRLWANLMPVSALISADNGLIDEYDLKRESAFYVDHVKFVRLVPDSPPASDHR